jgi:hypothetical protein
MDDIKETKRIPEIEKGSTGLHSGKLALEAAVDLS